MSELATFGLELRAAEGGDGRTLTGIAIPYGEVTMHSGHPSAAGGERFAAGAFKRTLAHRSGSLPKLFRNHAHDTAIGVATAMSDTAGGVVASWRIADTPAGNAALQEFREGVLDSLSVGFRAVRETMVDGVREIREAHLLEVSLVALPAYAGAMVMSVRRYDPALVTLPPRPDIDPDWVPRLGAHLW
jgi:HK97 family phage prohead protease